MEFVQLQLSSCLILLVAGMAWGGIFDLYRVFGGKLFGNTRGKTRRLIYFISDLFFWGIALVLIIPLIFWAAWLELRLYVWLLLFIGLLLYFALFSPIMIPLFLRLWRTLAWGPGWVLRQHRRLWLFIKKSSYFLRRK
ncbi:MAG: hypothetical protein K6U80_08205 [Firmicutes bacterium]|nr:hypothetical protein [Bacillota bacterium]